MVDGVDAGGGEYGGEGIFPVEWFAEANATAHCANHRNERIEDCHFAHRVATEQFVIQTESHGGDGDEQ